VRVILFRGPLPLLLPGIGISLLVAALVCRRVGRALGTHPLVAFMLVFSLGVIVATTLTPVRSALLGDLPSRSCDLSRIGPAPLAEYFSRATGGDAMGNVLLFIPLGWAIAMVPRSRGKASLVAAAILLPFAIEGLQLVVPALGRGCESADMFDNLFGLAIGLAAGAFTARFLPARVTRGDRGPAPGAT
jgi:hypothetical protein